MKLRGRKQETDIFSDSEEDTASIPTITHEQFQKLEEFLKAKDNPALLPAVSYTHLDVYKRQQKPCLQKVLCSALCFPL